MIDEIINAVNDVKAVEDSMAEVDKMLENTDKGFLYKETIYKVKNYE